MKLDKKILEEKIREYRDFKSCSESTLMGLCETAEYQISKAEMCKIACGFAGGIGGTFDEGTCGAVTGALIANGLVLDNPVKIKENAKEIFNSFKEKYGTVCCGEITNNGKDKSPCVDCCVFIANKVADLWMTDNHQTIIKIK
ncbi:C_GCAxxG_C_C family probable redox protein [Methanobrevibacter gottschalkii]|uniref:C_GCAxxG_C_C family probable redox protein n=1 Tax=Methanobrevibacter gottschalkii TaxID=190974 RepID=A0A1H7FHX0_9EURY|nr:C-GCAxxG-C-C family protein [Methanobrevibacter gottschalkii]SEK24042.1 C_GCAxxG_C_C family probable redox protein [Methanobrevibacter gottschalkii]